MLMERLSVSAGERRMRWGLEGGEGVNANERSKRNELLLDWWAMNWRIELKEKA